MSAPTTAPAPRERLDKWLWRARFYKTRMLAARAAEAGKVRVNGARSLKPGTSVKQGDVLTIALPSQVRVVRIEAFGARRGPASEARTLYVDLEDEERRAEADAPAEKTSGPDAPDLAGEEPSAAGACGTAASAQAGAPGKSTSAGS